jgi:hypothetical protein
MLVLQPAVPASTPATEKLYRCNNCDIELPVEKLRVPAAITYDRRYSLQYYNRAEKPRLYRDTLLCEDCRVEFKRWINTYPCLGHGHDQLPVFKESFHLIQFAGPVGRVYIEDWARHYWKRRFQEGKAGLLLPISRGQVPSRFDPSEASAPAQNLC